MVDVTRRRVGRGAGADFPCTTGGRVCESSAIRSRARRGGEPGTKGRRPVTSSPVRPAHYAGRTGSQNPADAGATFPATVACSELRYELTRIERTRCGVADTTVLTVVSTVPRRPLGCTPGETPQTSGATTHARRREIPKPQSLPKPLPTLCGRPNPMGMQV